MKHAIGVPCRAERYLHMLDVPPAVSTSYHVKTLSE